MPHTENSCAPPKITYLLASAWTITNLAYSIVFPFIPLYLHQDRGIAMAKVGLIFPLMGLAVITAPPIWGYLTDRFGRNIIMQIGQFSRGAVFLLLALAAYFQAPFEIFAILLMLSSGTGCAFQVAANSYLADITTPANRDISYGRISIGCNVGWATGPMLGSFLSGIPFYYLFFITGTLCVLCGAACRSCFPEPARRSHKEKVKAPWNALLQNPVLLQLILWWFLLTLLTSQLFSTMSVFATGSVGILRQTLGMVYSVNGFTVILCQQPMTMLLNRLRVPTATRLLLGALLYAVGYISMGFCSGAWFMAVTVFVLTLGELTVWPAFFSATAKAALPGQMGMTMAARGLADGVGMALGPWLGALAYAQWSRSPLLLWGVLAIPAILSGLGFLKMGRKIN